MKIKTAPSHTTNHPSMKRSLLAHAFVWICAGCLTLQAQPNSVTINIQTPGNISSAPSLYDMGLVINNCTANYLNQYLLNLSRAYHIPRSVLRNYLRAGFAPSDLLMGVELSSQSGIPLSKIMQSYYNSRQRDWIGLSTRWGIGINTPSFQLILNSFRKQCTYWDGYYTHRHAGGRPPMYAHSWSYFRPRPAAMRPSHQPWKGQPRPYTPQRPDRPYGNRPPQNGMHPSRPNSHPSQNGIHSNRPNSRPPQNNVQGKPRGDNTPRPNTPAGRPQDESQHSNTIRELTPVKGYRHARQDENGRMTSTEQLNDRAPRNNRPRNAGQSSYRKNSTTKRSDNAAASQTKQQQKSSDNSTTNKSAGYRR